MNKKKIIILAILFVAIAGFALAPASAATKTIKMKKGNIPSKYKIGGGDYLSGQYTPGYEPQNNKYHIIEISMWSSYFYPKYHKMVKAKVYYKKNGKIITKTYKGSHIIKKYPYGTTPYKALVYYKRK